MFNDRTINQQPIRATQHPIESLQPLFTVKVHAGFPSPATDYLEPSLDLNAHLVPNKSATFFFTVAGDSMSGAGILDGDRVVVDRSVDAEHNHIVIAIYNNEYTLKRLYKFAGVIELRPENPAFNSIRMEEGDELVIWGVVVGVIRKLRV